MDHLGIVSSVNTPTTHRWTKAAALPYGTHMRTPGGATATALGGHNAYTRTGWMWDLTIPHDHDFYVIAAATAVLVHNCPTASGGSASGARFVVRPNGAVNDLNGPQSQIELNHAAGDAFRDTVAGFLRSLGREVVTDGEDKAGLTINTPLGPRIFDIAVADSEGNPLGYIETKWGSSPYGGQQLERDEWLRSNLGVRIDVVYGEQG